MFVITVSLDFLEIKEMESQYYQLIFQLKYTCNVSQHFFLEWSFSFLFLVLSSVINSSKTSLNIPLCTKLDMWHLYEKGRGGENVNFITTFPILRNHSLMILMQFYTPGHKIDKQYKNMIRMSTVRYDSHVIQGEKAFNYTSHISSCTCGKSKAGLLPFFLISWPSNLESYAKVDMSWHTECWTQY